MTTFSVNSCPVHKVTVILGPTASGKTRLAHLLADRLSGAVTIINLDAFQFYKGFEIGTAQPSELEKERYSYWGIGFLEPFQSSDAQEHAEHVTQIMRQKEGNFILLGGSGLYTRAVLHGLDNLPPRDSSFRERIRTQAARDGWPLLHAELSVRDPARALELHPHDGVRIERALELCHLLGDHASLKLTKKSVIASQERRFSCHVIRLQPAAQILKSRISNRLAYMKHSGWENETILLWEKYGEQLKSFPAFKAIGYDLILDAFLQNKNIPWERIEQKTWQYAKRQLTWNQKEVADQIITAEDFFRQDTE